jgi:hypothetical protein
MVSSHLGLKCRALVVLQYKECAKLRLEKTDHTLCMRWQIKVSIRSSSSQHVYSKLIPLVEDHLHSKTFCFVQGQRQSRRCRR